MVRLRSRWNTRWCGVVAIALGLQVGVRAAVFEDGVLVTDQAGQAIGDYPVENSIDIPTESVLVAPQEEDFGDAEIPNAVVISDAMPGSCDSCAGGGCHDCLSPEGTINRTLLPVAPRWEAQVDALMLWQGNIPSRVLYVDNATGAPALDANQATPSMSAGARYGLFLNLDPVYSIEGNYFNVRSFNGEQSTAPTYGGYSLNNVAGYQFPDIDWGQVTSSGQIQSAELNWRRRTCGPITWLAGFRWVEWNQTARVYDVYNFGTGADVFTTQTGNDLYGGQAGMDLCLWNNKAGLVRVNGIGKAGVFYNTAYQRTAYFDGGNPPTEASARAEQTSFFGEVGANASVRLTKWLSLRAGYTVFWLSGVATAPQQFSATDLVATPPTATVNTNGSVLLHGVTTGLEARW
jgi:hypothetical protein